MKSLLQVLHIEDSKEDSELITQLLAVGGLRCETTRIETRAELFDALQDCPYDLILADCRLPKFSGLHALEIAHALKPDVPFVFVSGTMGEETAIESLRNGATDYVLKDRLTRLAPAVRRALLEAEERKLCRELQQRLREAGRLEAISTLSNGIAHDFNNILTIILGHASLLAAEKERPGRVLEIAGTITEAAQRAADVVEQLLAFAHKSEGHIAPLDLNRAVRDFHRQLEGKVPSAVEIVLELAADLPPVLADAHQVEHILKNLVENSLDSMPEGGRLKLSTRLVPAAEMPALQPQSSNSNHLCLKVTDTGMGMDLATREHVFEPFYTTKERRRGTGLGLPVVYGLMQAQHGWVEVDSEPGRGTTVSLYFPLTKAAPAEPISAKLDPSFNGTETVLVVEDEVDVCHFLETILDSHGYTVLTAHDPEEALELFPRHREKIALVFSDIGLPKMDGVALCTRLKVLRPTLPVILASGYSPKEFKDRMNDLGVEAFLAKPYRTRDLLECVRKVLDRTSVLNLH